MELTDLNPFVIDRVAPGVVKEKSTNGLLNIFVVENGHEVTVNRWAEAVKQTLLEWTTNQPCFLLHDLHKSGRAALDAHMHEDFQALYNLRGDMERYVAFVMPQGSIDLARMESELLAIKEKRSGTSRIHWSMFADRKEALRWLMEHMPN